MAVDISFMTEFDIIKHYFARADLAAQPAEGSPVVLGIGDDCALLNIAAGCQLAVSLDVLNPGVHFPESAAAELIARRALAVNLSDLAAMGAQPLGFTLGLSLPEVDTQWLENFSQGLLASARRYHCPLLGGDLTRSPLSIAIQVHGQVPAGKALTRSGAKPGDLLCVSGSLGGAHAGLQMIQGTLALAPDEHERAALHAAYYDPQPRLACVPALRRYATAAIDISDGLLEDVGHIARASSLAIDVQADAVPVLPAATKALGKEIALQAALNGSDDYELAFTVAAADLPALQQELAALEVKIAVVGEVKQGEGVRCLDSLGQPLRTPSGYNHFL